MFSRTVSFMRQKRILAIMAVAMVALIFGAATPQLSASRTVVPYDTLEFFIEVNSTDEDAGVQLNLDGEQWKQLKITKPEGSKLLDVKAKDSMQTQGLTEFFFESAEPSFDDVPLAEFLQRFPEGDYEFYGKTIDGDRMEGTATLTHVIPDGPVIISPLPGDLVDPNNAIIEWAPVVNPAGVQIVSYEVIAGSDGIADFKMHLPATATSIQLPVELFDPAITEYKFEILAREESGNQTITEREFETP